MERKLLLFWLSEQINLWVVSKIGRLIYYYYYKDLFAINNNHTNPFKNIFQDDIFDTNLGKRIIVRTIDNESHCFVDYRSCLVIIIIQMNVLLHQNVEINVTSIHIEISSTYSGKTLRRTTIFIGLVSLGLLAFQTGWETSQIINDKKSSPFGDLILSFNESTLISSSMWFNALVQVLFSTNIGIGVLPVLTGKFLYKGDAVR